MAQTKVKVSQLQATTSVGSPGVDTLIPTEKAVRDALSAGGVTRSGSTTDEHLAIWNGSDANSIKDGGAVPAGAATDGWVDATAETWTYASATTFTISGDLTVKYHKGTKLKWTQTTVKYGVVASSSYGAPNTTVTLITTSDYSVANAAISANYYSYIENPEGFPGVFNWSPTLTGFSADPTNSTYRWWARANVITLDIDQATAGTSNAANFKISLPVNTATITNTQINAPIQFVNNNNLALTPGMANLGSNASTVDLYTDWAGTGWATSQGKRCGSLQFSYQY